MNYNKKAICFIVSVLILLIALFLYEELTGDFRIKNLTFNLAYEPLREISPPIELQEKVKAILAQKFTWLGQGHQAFAFVSEDGKYVLKIFKFKRLKPSPLINFLSYIPFCEKYCLDQERLRKNRLKKLFSGYQTAYMYDQKNTGILFVQLNYQPSMGQEIVIIDRLGLSHKINSSQIIFALQEKGDETKKVFKTLIKRGDIQTLKKRLKALLAMYVEEYNMGIVDKDRNILSNTGFIQERPIRIDIGQLTLDETFKDKNKQKQDLQKIIYERLHKWFLKEDPLHADELLKEMETFIP